MCVLGVGGARGERGALESFPEDDKTQPESNRTGRCQLHVNEWGWAQPQMNLAGSTWCVKDTHVVFYFNWTREQKHSIELIGQTLFPGHSWVYPKTADRHELMAQPQNRAGETGL